MSIHHVPRPKVGFLCDIKQICSDYQVQESNPVNMNTEGVIESFRVERGLDLQKIKGLSFPRDKANCL